MSGVSKIPLWLSGYCKKSGHAFKVETKLALDESGQYLLRVTKTGTGSVRFEFKFTLVHRDIVICFQ